MDYKVGDKFEIEIEQVFEDGGRTLYRMKGFDTLIFSPLGLSKIKKIENESFIVGDEVKTNDGKLGVVLNIECDGLTVLNKDGYCYGGYRDPKDWHKTGKHYASITNLFNKLNIHQREEFG